MATLPRDLEYTTVNTMQLGERRWTSSRTMLVKPDRSLWLHGDYEVVIEQSRHHTMCIERRADGYHVWPDPRQTYRVRDNTLSELTWNDLISVQELHPGPHPLWRGREDL